MFLRILNTIVLVVLALATASAQQIRITVLDKENRKPVSLAYVNVYSSAGNALEQTEQTDEIGIATITPQKYPCFIEVSMQGYESYKKEYLTPPVNANPTITLIKKFSSLDEVVVTGLTQPTKLKNALSNYQVITKAQIQAQGSVSLGDALRTQLNTNINYDGILGSNITMQGMRGDKVKILVDGMPLNGREGGNISLGQINMNNVERIEVIQGPMSVVYGTDAIAGVINVITKKENRKFGGTINTYYESVGKYNADASFTYKLKDRSQFTVGGGRNYFGGYLNIDKPVEYSGKIINTKRSFWFKPVEQYMGNVAYSYTAPSAFKLNYATDYVKEIVTNKGSLQQWDPWGAYAIDEYYTTTRLLNRLSAEGKVGKKGKWQSQNSYNVYFRMKNQYTKNMVTLNQDPVPVVSAQDTTTFQNFTFRGSYNNSIKLLQYTAGYDINAETARSRKVDSGMNTNIQDYAAYLNLSYPLVKDILVVQGGVRAAYNNVYNPPVTPSLNLLYTPVKNLQVRASYTKGFRAPSLKEMYLTFSDANHELFGNPNLKPEKSDHVQLSASYQVYEKQSDYLQLSINTNYNDLNNGIVLVNVVPNTVKYSYLNVTHMSNVVNTLQADGQWRNLHAVLGVSYNYTFKEPNYYDAFDATEVTANLQYTWRKAGLNMNLFYKYSGSQPNLTYAIDGSASYDGYRDAINSMDASLEKKLFNKVRIITGMKNIFNVQAAKVTGTTASTGSVHGGGGATLYLPRSVYASLHINID